MPPSSLPGPTAVPARSLYLYESYTTHGWPTGGETLGPDDVLARVLYLVVNEGVHGQPAGGETMGPDDVLARILYLYVNEGVDLDPDDVVARALYDYVAYTDTEVFPWLEKLVPNEQFPLGQVDIYGDGFGATQAAEGGQVKLNGAIMGVVFWSARSPGLHPGPGPLTTQGAITVTVPSDAISGLVVVELTT